ncbi:hypothetical protein IVB38_18555 [Bradyrhizobium sp. 38]|uniref:hypothetical protein n=1 Tax=unclassified Bradyrhizobium TaxID=2631580 RepID=UPI001FFC2457|nr:MULTISPECIES: hypothetical protein [unclassified Bradyrhizobium]MCK1337964.1 hypothetical protein [Bradyrhizobium sp. 38]MCK1780396.1 hypothetical protein [Bradyrhizobium sp. 132]
MDAIFSIAFFGLLGGLAAFVILEFLPAHGFVWVMRVVGGLNLMLSRSTSACRAPDAHMNTIATLDQRGKVRDQLGQMFGVGHTAISRAFAVAMVGVTLHVFFG